MNINDIAKLAGVSVSTVSKVMNQKDHSISQKTRDKVLKIAKDYNYAPYASVLTPSIKTFQIGVLLRCLDSSRATLSGILATAKRLGYTVSLADTGGNSEEELKAITAFCKNRMDAILWEPIEAGKPAQAADLPRTTEPPRTADLPRTTDLPSTADPRCTKQIETAGIPYLLFHANASGVMNIDFSTMGYHAVHTLFSKGHRDIACVLTVGSASPGFLEGYRKGLFDHQIPFDEDLVFQGAGTHAALFDKIATKAVSGIVCSDYSAALAFCHQCSCLHYQIPKDVSILSLRDDTDPGFLYHPSISAYTVPHVQFGAFLCEKVIQAAETGFMDNQLFFADIVPNHLATIDLPPIQKAQKITVVGSINIDNYLNVTKLPTSGKTVRTTNCSLYPGGKGTNEAIGAAKLGHAVALVGNVGDDADSNLIYNALREYSVDSQALTRCLGQQTGRAYIIVEPGGDSLISILSGASAFLKPEDLEDRKQVFKNTAFALISTEIPMAAVGEACRLTRHYGGQTIVKPSSCDHIPDEILENIDILIPNHDEIHELAPQGLSISDKADYFLNRGVSIVIVTLGSVGCLLKTRDLEKTYPAMSFDAVDNTGAADAFIAAFASYLLYGYGLDSAIRIAAYAAGFSITREGVVPALIDRNTLEAHILQREPELLERS